MRLVISKFNRQAATEHVHEFCLRLQLELRLLKPNKYTSLFFKISICLLYYHLNVIRGKI